MHDKPFTGSSGTDDSIAATQFGPADGVRVSAGSDHRTSGVNAASILPFREGGYPISSFEVCGIDPNAHGPHFYGYGEYLYACPGVADIEGQAAFEGERRSWRAGAGCKPVASALRRFDSFLAHRFFAKRTNRAFLIGMKRDRNVHLYVWVKRGVGFHVRWRRGDRLWRHYRLVLFEPPRLKLGRGTLTFEWCSWLTTRPTSGAHESKFRVGLKSFVRLKIGFGGLLDGE